MTQNFGPEARGGSSSAAVVLSNEPIAYPYVTQPDVLVVLSQEAYTRYLPELKPGGTLIVERDLVRMNGIPSGMRVYSVPATRHGRRIGTQDGVEHRGSRIFRRGHGVLDPDALRRRWPRRCPRASAI